MTEGCQNVRRRNGNRPDTAGDDGGDDEQEEECTEDEELTLLRGAVQLSDLLFGHRSRPQKHRRKPIFRQHDRRRSAVRTRVRRPRCHQLTEQTLHLFRRHRGCPFHH